MSASESGQSSDSIREHVEAMKTIRSNTTPDIPKYESIENWKTGPTMYVLKQLIQPTKGKIDQKITTEHTSEAVIWNIIHMKDDLPFPTDKPRIDELVAVEWLHRFRKELVKVLMERVRHKYYVEVNEKAEYASIKINNQNFTSYRDLERRTENMATETVSDSQAHKPRKIRKKFPRKIEFPNTFPKHWRFKFQVNQNTDDIVKEMMSTYNIKYRDNNATMSKPFIEKIATYAVTRVRRTLLPRLVHRSKLEFNANGKRIKKEPISTLAFRPEIHVKKLNKEDQIHDSIAETVRNGVGEVALTTECQISELTDTSITEAAAKWNIVDKFFREGGSTMSFIEYRNIANERMNNSRDDTTRDMSNGEETIMHQNLQHREEQEEQIDMPPLQEAQILETNFERNNSQKKFENDNIVINKNTTDSEESQTESENESTKNKTQDIRGNESSDETSDEDECNLNKTVDSITTIPDATKGSVFLDNSEDEKTDEEIQHPNVDRRKKLGKTKLNGKEHAKDKNISKQRSNTPVLGNTNMVQDREVNTQEGPTDVQTKQHQKIQKKQRKETYKGSKDCKNCHFEMITETHPVSLKNRFGVGMKCGGDCGRTLEHVCRVNKVAWVCAKCSDMKCRKMFCVMCRSKNEDQHAKRRGKRKRQARQFLNSSQNEGNDR